MRVWDVSPAILCRQHLLGEHREIHALWKIITDKKKGYSKHPETQRWYGKLHALYLRHEELVKEMDNRGYKHQSPLDKKYAKGKATQQIYIHTPAQQLDILRLKKCLCKVD